MDNQEGQESNQRLLTDGADGAGKLIRNNAGKLLHDDFGNFSSMRLMSFIAFMAVILLALVLVGIETFSPDTDLKSIEEIIKWLLGAAFGPKAVQKFAEVRAKS